MAARYTSTSLGSMLRSAAASVRAAKLRPLQQAAKVRQAIARQFQTATASVGSVHHAQFAHVSPKLHHVHAHARLYSTPSFSPRTANYGNTSRTFGSRYRPTLRGAAVPANVGLGSARTFASGPATFAKTAHNVPVVLRAFSQIFDDDDLLPKGTRYSPYMRKRFSRRSPRGKGLRAPRRTSITSTTSTASLIRELGHYFPIVLKSTKEVQLPPQPEQLVTPGYTATLALPLAPSLNTLLEPTATVPYSDAEIGVAILARLTHGLLPLHDAYAAAGARVIPLLARLDALGILDPRAGPPTTLDVATNFRGEPDILRVIFAGRSAQDVRDLLGDEVDSSWCALSEARHVIVPIEEEDEAKVAWERPAPSRATSTSSVDLVMPTLAMSIAPTVVPSAYESDFDVSHDFSDDEHDFESNSSWSASPASDMSGISTPNSDSWSSSPASLLSSLSESLSEHDMHDSWISPPSEVDADLDAWSEASVTLERARDHERELVEEVDAFWVGSGLSLTQSW